MPNFKRRIRIKCDSKHPIGNCLEIEDLSTGKAVTRVTEAKIHLKAGDLNTGQLTYIKTDEQGRPIPKDNYVEQETIEVEVPEVDLTVFESFDYHGIRDCLEQALTTDGAQHKQWYLWQLADLLGLSLDIDADKGITS